MMNSHVIKWISWQHLIAVRSGRQFAQLFWSHSFNEELKSIGHQQIAD